MSDDEDLDYADDQDADIEAGPGILGRKSSAHHRATSDQPLLPLLDSRHSDTQEHDDGGAFSQKFYIESEDLTMVVAGFSTSLLGFITYATICILTGGIGYLVFRWLPRWRIRLTGVPTPLRKCTWTVVEVSSGRNRERSKSKTKKKQNQWGEFTVHPVEVEEYGHAMSTVFNRPTKEQMNGHRYDGDRDLQDLRRLDYRYLRFIYHPDQDKFVLNNDWWDSQWTDVKAMREGLDGEEHDPRDQVFGKNMIDIKEKSIPALLVDEVSIVFELLLVTR